MKLHLILLGALASLVTAAPPDFNLLARQADCSGELRHLFNGASSF